MGPDEAMTASEGFETFDRARVQCRDRGDETFLSHVEVARRTGVAIDWLEDKLRAESIIGFELEDGQWVTTVKCVRDLLGRRPAGLVLGRDTSLPCLHEIVTRCAVQGCDPATCDLSRCVACGERR